MVLTSEHFGHRFAGRKCDKSKNQSKSAIPIIAGLLQSNEEWNMAEPSGVAADQLRAFVERIERLEEEKQSIADDIKDVYGEAKGTGFDSRPPPGRPDPPSK